MKKWTVFFDVVIRSGHAWRFPRGLARKQGGANLCSHAVPPTTRGRVVATALLARWRRQIFELEGEQVDIETLVGGGPALVVGGHPEQVGTQQFVAMFADQSDRDSIVEVVSSGPCAALASEQARSAHRGREVLMHFARVKPPQRAHSPLGLVPSF